MESGSGSPPEKGELEGVSLLVESLAVLGVQRKPLPASPCQGRSQAARCAEIGLNQSFPKSTQQVQRVLVAQG